MSPREIGILVKTIEKPDRSLLRPSLNLNLNPIAVRVSFFRKYLKTYIKPGMI